MKIPFTGGCACRAIRYECSEFPVRMINCHCRDCQIAGGGAYSPTLIMAATAVHLTTGAAKQFAKTAQSGKISVRGFCAECGTPLFAASSARPKFIGIRAASLDDPTWFTAEADVWVGSAQPWDCMDQDIPKFERGPPGTGAAVLEPVSP